jgi:hypothetical protein
MECDTSDLKSHDGVVTVPGGAGIGVTIDPEFIEKHKAVIV